VRQGRRSTAAGRGGERDRGPAAVGAWSDGAGRRSRACCPARRAERSSYAVARWSMGGGAQPRAEEERRGGGSEQQQPESGAVEQGRRSQGTSSSAAGEEIELCNGLAEGDCATASTPPAARPPHGLRQARPLPLHDGLASGRARHPPHRGDLEL
jgi:hypothetical protein